MRRRVYLAAFAVHFFAVLAVCSEDTLGLIGRNETALPASIAHVAEVGRQLIQKTLRPKVLFRSYLHLAGSESGYSYFAPNVANSYRLTLEMHLANAPLDHRTTINDQSADVLRLSTLIDQVGEAEPEQLRELLIRSIVASAWRKYPEVTSTHAILGVSDLPTLAEYVQGRRLTYRSVSAYDFSLRHPKP
ncbi:MAG: hypothetical protein ACR2HH_05085 [Chthoniobacterales bacterium]